MIKRTFSFLFILLAIGFCLLASKVSAQTRFPISELGNCRDRQECRLYCEIPANKPACWSYGKFINSTNVLGEETSIAFPVAELGNCADKQACRSYCERVENRKTCMEFARKKGIGQYKKHQEMVGRAKEALGCDSMESCQAFCSQEANREKCSKFADQHAPEEFKQRKDELIKKAKETLGCDSFETCHAFCENPQNREKCMKIAEAAGHRMEMRQNSNVSCSSEEECSKVCSESPDKCPGYKEGTEKMRKFREEGEQKKHEFEIKRKEEMERRRTEFEGKFHQPQAYPTGSATQYKYPTETYQKQENSGPYSTNDQPKNYSPEDYQNYQR